MPTRDDWIREFERLGIPWKDQKAVSIPNPKGSWCWFIAAESGNRKYKSIVIQWTGKGIPPELQDTFRDYEHKKCSRADLRKGWLYRLWIEPRQLEAVLCLLREVGKSGPWPVTGSGRGSVPPTPRAPVSGDSEYSLREELLNRWKEIPECSNWVEPKKEYRLSRGSIDLLAEGKVEKALLVVEVKRNKADKGVLRQLREYIRLAKREIDPDARVLGWIVASSADPELRAICGSESDVKFYRWQDLLS